MNERLLQFIWQYRYFDQHELLINSGEPIELISPGVLNTNQGPDFLDAKIRIGHTTWAGNIELHIKSSDWNKHGHEADVLYRNVILHGVWEHDKDVNDIPVLELKGRVPGILLERYRAWM